jgi:alpha-L-arabinofuranosidase
LAASIEDPTGDILLKIANPLAQSCRAQIHLHGAKTIQPEDTLTRLTGDRGDANVREQPDRVKPVVSELPVAASFPYNVPAMSVQFIRVRQ